MCARSKIGDVESVAPAVHHHHQHHHEKRMRRPKRKPIQDRSRPAEPKKSAPFYKDILALVTERQRVLVWKAYELYGKFQNSKVYSILFHTAQPAHLLMIVAIVTTFLLINQSRNRTEVPRSPLLNLIYLTAFMTHFGSQIWMTFVSGLSLYFALSRHTFGEVQQVLFPRYFSLNSFLSLVTLIVYVKLNPATTWDKYITFQVIAMALCFLLELTIRLYFAPPLLSLIGAKIAMEKAAGVGCEVGRHDPGPLAKCPHYVRVHKSFRKVHMSIAIGNILAMSCTIIHLLHLSNKICVL